MLFYRKLVTAWDVVTQTACTKIPGLRSRDFSCRHC